MSPYRPSRQLAISCCAAIAASLGLACGGSDATSTNGGDSPLAVGSTRDVASRTVSLAGGSAGGEYVFVVADTAVDGSSAATTFEVTTTGVGGAGAVSAPATSRTPSGLARATRGPTLDFSVAARINARARAVLAPRVAFARKQRSRRASSSGGFSASVSARAAQVGDVLTLNVSENPCDSLVLRSTRIVALGSQSIVVADTLNPVGGFTQADYERFAARFDTLVYPIDVANFGVPAAFGPEGKIVLLFTTAVNELTPRNSQSYVGVSSSIAISIQSRIPQRSKGARAATRETSSTCSRPIRPVW